MNTDITSRIISELESVEKAEDVRIVYACESGSRAWGFESTDSDYDVRFIYVHPVEWYLRIASGRDVIERPIDDELDVSGWDLRKALQLLRKSNPPLLEWLQSPTVYRESPKVAARLRALVPDYYSPASCHYHYFHMAERNYRQYLHGDEVWIKKYFYVLRPILACLWIERGLGVVPMEFADLVNGVVDDDLVREEIDALVLRKRAGEELDRGPRIPVISDFVDAEMARLADRPAPAATPTSGERLDQAFRQSLIDVYGDRFR